MHRNCIASHRIASHRIAPHRIASHRAATHRTAQHASRAVSHRLLSLVVACCRLLYRIANVLHSCHYLAVVVNDIKIYKRLLQPQPLYTW
jgi:hypothetical protein